MQALVDPATLIVAIGSLGAFLTILAVGLPLISRSPARSRLKAVARRREELSQAQKARFAARSSSIRQQVGKGYITYLVNRLRLVNPAGNKALSMTLAQAGLRSQAHLYTYAFFRFATPVLFGTLTALYLFLFLGADLGLLAIVAFAGIAAAVGFYLPQVLLRNRIQNRRQALAKAFPDALDLMVICVEAGLSMEAAFARVAEEIQDQGPELAEEISLTTAELAFLPDRRQALLNLADRTGLPTVKALVTALAQAERYGTPIGVSLRVQAQEQRDSRMSRAEQKAGALPAQLTVPMIAFFLPVLFIVLLGPAIIKTMNAI